MMPRSPPLRFLALAVGAWVCVRSAMLVPSWGVGEGAASPSAGSGPRASGLPEAARREEAASRPSVRTGRGAWRPIAAGRVAPETAPLPSYERVAAAPQLPGFAARIPPDEPMLPSVLTMAGRAPPTRWSGSAWLLVRGGGAGPLAPGGTLGGSQAGVRFAYRLAGGPNRPLALTARLSGPLGRRSAAEAALGVEWRPFAALTFNLLAERRQALGDEARSAFAFSVHGEVSRRRVARGVILDAYAQAGIVGARSRDLFADGSANLSLGAGRAEVGAGLWGGAQPGAARLDLGPRLAVRLPAPGGGMLLSAEWRFRVAGDARPGSGPAITVAAGF